MGRLLILSAIAPFPIVTSGGAWLYWAYRRQLSWRYGHRYLAYINASVRPVTDEFAAVKWRDVSSLL